ncbi:N-acetylmuramoyl-L-alanine amidase [Patescibacteria group bacterium]|nr:N-acetylmuramoyl-L-alanine amidase [Patescibacteria group bacterium]MBU1015938.1 N-acetylmuramoyl-L-alanine amidase [Patescibacteria group bacterium]MBU1685497.1 N-acetylmuramoyl-L-alanine amidase [Patescibacteria group bacterium]MBU1938691.1 N-acetylmuramoyl-L-alanine amidase [Patescibacteria group bacterium]
MNTKKYIKNVFLSSAFVGLLFTAMPKALAVDFTEHEIMLERQGEALISEVILERQAFNTVIVKLEKDIDGLMVNFGNKWEEVEIHDDGWGDDRLVVTSPTHTMRFRWDQPGTDTALNLKATVFYYEEDESGGLPSKLQASSGFTAGTYKIITRREWGADEELRVWNSENIPASDTKGDSGTTYVDPCADIEKNYAGEFELTMVKEYNSDGQPLTWPLQYAKKLEKFVVHHTDSEIRDLNGDSLTDTRDYQAIMRAIYYYHTISRGWGDIGYNYVIDPLGNIYEGRFGGDKVIGAHALCYNHGTLGIAVIGDYQNNEVPEPALQALIWLIGKKGKEYGIDPQGASTFRGKSLFNVIGHKDVRATSCPGEKLYALLPKIRDRAALAMRNFSESTLSASEYDYNAELISDLSIISLGPGERKSVTLKFKNTGKKSWDNTTWLHVALNNDPNARVVPAVEDKSFVAADLQEDSVNPGKTGTFIVEVEGGFKPGHYAFQLSPVVNGRYKISRASEYVSLKVEKPVYDYEVIGHKFPSGTVFQGQKILATVELKNNGNVTWRNYGNNPITLGASEPKDRASIFIKDNPSRIGYLADSEVAPGETGHFVLNLSVPEDREGEVIERFIPVIENAGWLADKALGFKVKIKKPVHLARTLKVDRLGSMYPGERRFVQVDMINMGDLPWDSSTVETTLLGRGIKVFKRMLLPQESVKPGETMKIGFWVEAPMEAGQHTIYLRSRFNGKPIRGAVAQYVVAVPESVLRGGKMEQGDSIVNIAPREEKELTVKFKNTGNVVWKKMGANPVHLGTSQPNDRQSKVYVKSDWLDPFRAAELEEEEVMPGKIGTFKLKVRSDVRGRFSENFQLVMEGVGWITGANVRWQVNVTGDIKTSSSQTSTSPKNTATSTAAPSATLTITPTTTTTPVATPITTEKPFRVRLSHDASTATLTADKPFLVLNEKDQAIFNLSAGKEISVKKVASVFQVKSGSITKNATIVRLMPKEEGGISEIVTMEHRPAWNTSLNDNRFRGIIEMRVINGQVAYINELPLKDYLKGLAEVSNGDHPEKQKTIAVLARTYARFYMDEANRKFPGMPYDGSDDPAIFQRYLGYGVEVRSPNFVSAAQATEDMVVTYQGNLIKTPYFNQSDGRTRSAEEVWGWTNTPYLKSVSDPACAGLELKGHGVGLSGFGATAQAEAGKTFEEIIKYYYSGVAIEKIVD